jgi:hypothetical protein
VSSEQVVAQALLAPHMKLPGQGCVAAAQLPVAHVPGAVIDAEPAGQSAIEHIVAGA